MVKLQSSSKYNRKETLEKI